MLCYSPERLGKSCCVQGYTHVVCSLYQQAAAKNPVLRSQHHLLYLALCGLTLEQREPPSPLSSSTVFLPAWEICLQPVWYISMNTSGSIRGLFVKHSHHTSSRPVADWKCLHLTFCFSVSTWACAVFALPVFLVKCLSYILYFLYICS